MLIGQLRVLILEDNLDDAELTVLELSRHFETFDWRRVDMLADLKRALEQDQWDVLISDYSLPEFSAESALQLTRSIEPNLPFIVLSGHMGEEIAVSMMRAGASDYLFKDNLSRLAPAIERELREARIRRNHRATEEELRLARTSVERSEARLKRIIATMNEGVIISDDSGNLIDWNQVALELHGYESLEEVRRNLLSFSSEIEIYLPSGRLLDVSEWPMARLLRGEVFTNLELYVRLQSKGIDRFFNYSGTQLRDSAGNVELNILTLHDVTGRVRAEESLRLRDRAIEALSDSILITDCSQADLPIVYASPAFETLTGYSIDEAVGKNCRFLQGKDTDPQTVEEIRKAISAQQSCRVEILNYRKNGLQFWNALSLSPIFSDEDKLTHYVGIQSDVTKLKELQDQYRQSQKMEVVGQLAGGIAHDFNNLITIIQGYSHQLLKRLTRDDPFFFLVEEIERAGQMAAALTRQLLAFSRREVTAPRVISMNTVLENMDRLLRRVVGEEFDLEIKLSPDLGYVKVDPSLLEQVVLNLIINSRDAMSNAGKITIETKNIESAEIRPSLLIERGPGSFVSISVEDAGSGISPEVMSRIFEPFFSTKERGKGTGLGLAVVHGVVNQAAGFLDVESELGRGTKITAYFPRQNSFTEVERAKEDHTITQTTPATILLCEDEEGVRRLLIGILREEGFHVLETAQGANALELAASYGGAIDLLITDVVLPGMSGRELAKQICSNRASTKVLYISGYTDDAVMAHGVLHAEVEFLQKPFSPAVLIHRVHKILNG